MELRQYQIDLSTEGANILKRKGLLYLQMQVRTGKTLTALETCKIYGAKKVLFITKIKAFSSIKGDYDNFAYTFDLNIINKESIHKIETNDFDIIICDEAHGLFGTFPKPNNFTKIYKKRFHKIPAILLSGTPSPESYSQLFHQFWINDFAPFREYMNFYKWAKDYVNIVQRNVGYAIINDYSDANIKKFGGMIKHFILKYTQEQAGFESKVNEMVFYVEMQPMTNEIIKRLKKDRIVKGQSGGVILADTGAKLMQKHHQLSSGTIKFEDSTAKVIDETKALYILDHFKDYKIAIYYKFIAEGEMLKKVIGQKLTTDLDEFNETDKWIALQFVSGREGISLAKADCLVAMNIDFSATTYWQFRDRLTTKDRKENDLFWIFSRGGIEEKIYKTVKNKENFTLKHYEIYN